MVPELQQDITDPQTGALYRVDYLWRLPDGRLIVGEYDGYEKYTNPNMNDRRGIQRAVHAEKEGNRTVSSQSRLHSSVHL